MHPMRLLALNAQIAAIFFFPIWFLWDVVGIWNDLTALVTQNRLPDLRFLAMLLASGFLSFLQNLCAFTLIHKLTALSYAVTNATKRITVISVSLLTLHNPVDCSNMFGMCLAVVGIFLSFSASAIVVDQIGSGVVIRSRRLDDIDDENIVIFGDGIGRLSPNEDCWVNDDRTSSRGDER